MSGRIAGRYVNSEYLHYRLKSLFLPVAALSAGLFAGYSLINWLLLAGPGIQPLDDNVIDYWIPLTLAAFLEFALVAPRLQFLAFNRHTMRFLTNAIAFAVIAAPVCVAQGQIRAASGHITHVRDASEIAQAPTTRYYAVQSICIDREQSGIQLHAEADDDRLNFDMYIVLLVCAPGTSASQPGKVPVAWIGLRYQGSAPDTSSPETRKAALVSFTTQVEKKVLAEDPYRYQFLERSSHSAERRNYDLALQTRGITAPQQQIILIPHFEAFEQRTGKGWKGVVFVLGFGALSWLTLVLLAPLDWKKIVAARRGAKTPTNPAMTILIPTASSYGLQGLIYLNLVVFLAMIVSGLGFLQVRPEDLINWGGNYGPRLEGLGLLRLFTCQFVHSGIMHLVNNMYGLILVGLFLAPAIGSWQMIVCYLVCGLGGSIAGAWAHPNIVSVGASGAILGLLGIALTLALLRDSRVAAMRPALMTNLAIFSAFVLIMGGRSAGIDNVAHLGGFATGVVMGCALHLIDRRPEPVVVIADAAEDQPSV